MAPWLHARPRQCMLHPPGHRLQRSCPPVSTGQSPVHSYSNLKGNFKFGSSSAGPSDARWHPGLGLLCRTRRVEAAATRVPCTVTGAQDLSRLWDVQSPLDGTTGDPTRGDPASGAWRVPRGNEGGRKRRDLGSGSPTGLGVSVVHGPEARPPSPTWKSQPGASPGS